jgi:hypothetical protein
VANTQYLVSAASVGLVLSNSAWQISTTERRVRCANTKSVMASGPAEIDALSKSGQPRMTAVGFVVPAGNVEGGMKKAASSAGARNNTKREKISKSKEKAAAKKAKPGQPAKSAVTGKFLMAL